MSWCAAGPSRVVRHPIYLALFLYLLSYRRSHFGHWLQLLVAMPLYLAGTLIRIRDEENCCERSSARTTRASARSSRLHPVHCC